MSGRGGRRYGAGRKPKPTALKQLADNPGGRPLNDAEPQPDIPSIVPPAPDHLDAVAKKEWNRRGKQLIDCGVLTEIDTSAFEAYCCAYSRFVDANKELQKGVIIKGRHGIPTLNPYLIVARTATAEMVKFLAEFGMTPSSRSRIQIKRSNTDPKPNQPAPAAPNMGKLEEKYLN